MKTKKVFFSFKDALVDRENMWFINAKTGALFHYHMQTKNLNFRKVVFKEKKGNAFSIRKMIKYGKYIFLVSDQGYAICKGMVRKTELEIYSYYQIAEGASSVIKEVFLCGDVIWLMPSLIEEDILAFHIATEEFENKGSLLDWMNQFKIQACSNRIMTVKSAGDKMYFTLESGDALIELDVRKGLIREYCGFDTMRISGFDVAGDIFWLRDKKGITLHKWKIAEGIVKSYFLKEINELEKSEEDAKVLVTSNGKVILLPRFSNSIVYLDEEKESLYRVKQEDVFCHCKGQEKFTFSIGNAELDGKLFLFPWAEEKLILIDLENMRSSSLQMKMDDDCHRKVDLLQCYWYLLQRETEENTFRSNVEFAEVNEFIDQYSIIAEEYKGAGMSSLQAHSTAIGSHIWQTLTAIEGK